jgi:glycosyltransferase 2 family protein
VTTAEPEAALPSRAGVILRSVLGLVAGLAAAGVVMWRQHVDFRDVGRQVVAAPLWVVAGAVASGFVTFAFQSLRWHSVMQPLLGLRYADSYRAQVVGYMFNQILPARGGDLLRVQYLGRRTGKSRATILGTEVVDRWLDLWGPIQTILVLALFTDLPPWVFKALAFFGSIVAGMTVLMLVLTRRGYTPRPGARFASLYTSLSAGIEAFRSPRIWLIALTVAPLPWLWEAGMIYRLAGGFGIHIGLVQAFCVLVGFNAAMVVPSPGAIGAMEAGGAGALAWFGVDISKALAFLTVYHFAQMIPGILAGVVILAGQREGLIGKKPADDALASGPPR